KPGPPRPAKLDPCKRYVIERVGAAAPEVIPASVLLMELRERGYSGGYTMLKLFVASLRPKQAVEPAIRFETDPGEQMQVDWAVIRRGSNRLSVFVATLGWSRAAYVEFVTDERVETLIEAHENAFLALVRRGLPGVRECRRDQEFRRRQARPRRLPVVRAGRRRAP